MTTVSLMTLSLMTNSQLSSLSYEIKREFKARTKTYPEKNGPVSLVGNVEELTKLAAEYEKAFS